MRTRLWSMTTAALATMATLALVAPGCTHRNPDIDRVVDPYWPKTDFVGDNATWYYRSTVVDTPPSASWFTQTIADGDWLLLERVRWEVTENALIGYRDYASAPGTENDLWEGANDVYDGSPVAVFAITDHFDVRRGYDSLTGEEGNVIMENRERPWYDRQYFRVDWSANRVPTFRFHTTLEQLTDSYVVQNNDPGDPKRFRFEHNDAGELEYFEVTTRSQFFPDIASLIGFNGPGYFYDNAAIMMDLRHSFLKASEADLVDFETVNMPNTVILTDEDGNEVRDERGIAKRVPIADRFGIYSTGGRIFWDPNRGATDGGRQYHATVFNLWEKSFDDNGALIPMQRRTPKPIVYYTNVTHPKQLLRASIERVGAQWNDAFKNAVYLAQTVDVPAAERPYDSLADVPDMFIVRENDCNPANVKTVLDGLPAHIQTYVRLAAQEPEFDQNGKMLFDGSIDSVVQRYELANAADNDQPFSVRSNMETQALEDLERVCTALEYYTDPKISGDESLTPFKYQRFGDVRYNMMNLIMQDHNNMWLGYGPMLGDPVTGRTVQATANIAVKHLDLAVERFTQMVDVMNGVIDEGDLISGMDVQAYMTDKLAKAQQLTSSSKPSEELRQSMRSRIAGLGPAHEALQEISPTYVEDRLSRVAGTPVEPLLIANDDALVFGGIDINAAMSGDITMDEALLEELSPARGRLKHSAVNRDKLVQRLGMRTMDTMEIVDRWGWSVALRLKDEPDRRKRFEKIREELYVAVQLHEVGHNVGLVHNFEASSDALNYGERFWRLQKYPTDPATALGDSSIPDADRAIIDSCITEQAALNDRLEANGYDSNVQFTTQECLGQQEGMYSSIMDYHGTWNGDFNGLGPYDKAAIKFAYAGVLETFPMENLQADPNTTDLKKWGYYNDWRDIAGELVTDHDAVNEREHIKWKWGPASVREAPPANTVPYRYCYGGYYGNTPWCQTGDIGPDMQTNASLNMTRWYQYYFFTHFNRGRLWDWGGDGMQRAFGADESVLWDFTKKMQWYVFLSLSDPDFKGSYAEDDFLATTVTGLNHFAAVIGQPGSGYQVSVPNYMVETDLELPPDADRLAPSDLMMPWDWLGSCSARNIAETNNAAYPSAPKPGYALSYIPLGDGRPFFLGLTEDYEDWYIRYLGNYWAKWDALFYLGYNAAWFPRTNIDNDPRVFDVSWYRLFPDLVGNVFHSIITEHDQDIGPLVDSSGKMVARQLIDPATGQTPDYTGYKKVLPSIAYNHRFLSILYAHALMSSRFDSERDFLKSFKVAVEGAEDDFGSFDYVIEEALANNEDPADYVAEFIHPVSGRRVRALNTGDNPVAYDVVKRANFFRTRYERTAACANDPEGIGQTDPYCYCVLSVEERPNGYFCSAFYLETPGNGICNVYDVERRADSQRESMDDVSDYIDDIRVFNNIFSEW